MGHRIAIHSEYLAAGQVHPNLRGWPFWIVAQVEIGGPGLVTDLRTFRPDIAEIASEMKFALAAQTAEWTRKKLHHSTSMCDAGTGGFIDQPAPCKSIEIERPADLMVFAGCEQVREQRASGRDCLEPAGSPAAVQEETG